MHRIDHVLRVAIGTRLSLTEMNNAFRRKIHCQKAMNMTILFSSRIAPTLHHRREEQRVNIVLCCKRLFALRRRSIQAGRWLRVEVVERVLG